MVTYQFGFSKYFTLREIFRATLCKQLHALALAFAAWSVVLAWGSARSAWQVLRARVQQQQEEARALGEHFLTLRREKNNTSPESPFRSPFAQIRKRFPVGPDRSIHRDVSNPAPWFILISLFHWRPTYPVSWPFPEHLKTPLKPSITIYSRAYLDQVMGYVSFPETSLISGTDHPDLIKIPLDCKVRRPQVPLF